jgi:hypothetical protein
MTSKKQKPAGLTRDTGWQVGLRRTYTQPHHRAWELITSLEGVQIWLGDGEVPVWSKGETYHLKDGTKGEIRVYNPLSHLRITRQPFK